MKFTLTLRSFRIQHLSGDDDDDFYPFITTSTSDPGLVRQTLPASIIVTHRHGDHYGDTEAILPKPMTRDGHRRRWLAGKSGS